jgi:hypothetical protein
MLIPTPTPFPDTTPIATLAVPDNMAQDLSYQAVQWWNIAESHGITQSVQFIIILILIIGGTVLIMHALRGVDE